MEETHVYTVAPKRPIRGLVKGKVIIKPTDLNLTKDEVKMCMTHGPVYRKFYLDGSERVTPSNLDRLHRTEHLTEEQYKALLAGKTEEPEVEEVVDEAPAVEEVIEETETVVEEVEEVSEEEEETTEELKKEEEEQLSTESEELVEEALVEETAPAPKPKKKKTTSKKKKIVVDVAEEEQPVKE